MKQPFAPIIGFLVLVTVVLNMLLAIDFDVGFDTSLLATSKRPSVFDSRIYAEIKAHSCIRMRWVRPQMT